MPETPSTAPAKTSGAAAKKSGPKILIIAIVALLIIGGGGYWFVTHRALASAKSSAKTGALAATKPAGPIAVMQLDAFVVNLADANGGAYLRVGITLGLDKPLAKEAEATKDSLLTSEIRDAILATLTTWQSSDLLAQGGKMKLKAQLLAALQSKLPQLGVVDIYFTDFLIQQ